ncbi:MAG: preprotein translocase subunit SecA [Desulfobacteraceae bacterium]|nr:preprotein translocase subunit SecA [Desulfobacteraceae bacterium]
MFLNFFTKLFGSNNERVIKKMHPLVELINKLEPEMQKLDDNDFPKKTDELKQKVENGAYLNELLPEAFALVREASLRSLGMRHYDVQLIGGIVLHNGSIAEMKTGEGKTIVAPLAAYLNSLTGKGVHIITVNDYLATRDSEWMGKLFNFLGLSVGVILHDMNDQERKDAYNADISYGTNNEFGFDYLRDNMKFEKKDLSQGHLNFAIVDEVDSILIDEARTPLIISGPTNDSTGLYHQINTLIPSFKKEIHYTIDEESKSVMLTEDGIAHGEKLLNIDNLYDPSNIETLHHLNQALKAHKLFKKDVDYVVKNNEVIIVDEFTGRLMAGRRYSEGLHQALEAKENVKIENENQTLASVTFQNYFRMYDKLSGMTGTAETEAPEFQKIYNLSVIVVPTNLPMIRHDFPDAIYKNKKEKFDAVIKDIIKLSKKGQPVLVGTISIDVSEDLSKKLKKKGIKHSVLNAKHHKSEAEIVTNAGQKGVVTISTNMAGRGTDIVLGDGVKELGGLHILGTSRHESRRIDNQLRGRSGRQGDEGSSKFYLSLEDELLRIFGGDRIHSIMDKIGIGEGEPIEHKLISRAIENAQAKVEGQNCEIRKHLLDYDDVMNQQRDAIYSQRRKALQGANLKDSIIEMIEGIASNIIAEFEQNKTPIKQWDTKGLSDRIKDQFGFEVDFDLIAEGPSEKEELDKFVIAKAKELYTQKEDIIGDDEFRQLERFIMLQTVDSLWKDHLLSMDHLKEGIGLRSYGQQNPLIIYKREGYRMFEDLIGRIKEDTIKILFRIQITTNDFNPNLHRPEKNALSFSHSDGSTFNQPIKNKNEKIGRNEPCPCGSGKKYKKCCGK